MPELRYNPVTHEWVIISTERAKRPEDFAGKTAEPTADSAVNCPFCNGREDKTPPEIFAIREPGTAPNTPGWKVRVINNAFPALSSEGDPDLTKTKAGYLKMNGVGKHEVIIETPDHEKIIATMDLLQVENIFQVYKERYAALSKDPRIEAVILFKNHGRGAGTSLHHPHSQVIALPVTPKAHIDRLNICRSYFEEHRRCAYCDLIDMEKLENERIILETDNFIAFALFAPRVPFETWVVPKTHNSNFDQISDNDTRELAFVMKCILEKFYRGLNNPDMNYAIYSAPIKDTALEYWHWSLKIFPRITNLAGFEVGSSMSIVSVIPEAAADFLRKA